MNAIPCSGSFFGHVRVNGFGGSTKVIVMVSSSSTLDRKRRLE